jgi:hypothetical protein
LKLVQAEVPGFLMERLTTFASSSDLNTWTNQGSAFTATNPAMVYPQYFNVAGWNQLFFRLQAAP